MRGRIAAPSLCSKVALADTVEDPLEASPLCSKVALADSVEGPLEASPLCGGGIDAKMYWRETALALHACAKLTSQMFAFSVVWVTADCPFNADNGGCLYIFSEDIDVWVPLPFRIEIHKMLFPKDT